MRAKARTKRRAAMIALARERATAQAVLRGVPREFLQHPPLRTIERKVWNQLHDAAAMPALSEWVRLMRDERALLATLDTEERA